MIGSKKQEDTPNHMQPLSTVALSSATFTVKPCRARANPNRGCTLVLHVCPICLVLVPRNCCHCLGALEHKKNEGKKVRRPLRSTCRNRKKCHRQEVPGKQLEPEHGEEAEKRSEIANRNKSMKALQYREQIDVLRRPHDLTNVLHLLGSLIFMATEIVAMISRINITRKKL